MRSYSAEELLELAGGNRDDITLGAAGEYTGVVIGIDLQAGAIIHPDAARIMAAQLLVMADLYEAIFDSGFKFAQGHANAENKLLRGILKEVREVVFWKTSGFSQPSLKEYQEVMLKVQRVTGASDGEDI